jgi:hypothetical protein
MTPGPRTVPTHPFRILDSLITRQISRILRETNSRSNVRGGGHFRCLRSHVSTRFKT